MSDTEMQTTPATDPRQDAAPPPRTQALVNQPVGPLDFFGDAQSFVVGQRMATMLASASIVPDTYRSLNFKNDKWVDNPDAIGNCFIALELASRLHVSPIMVMQQVDMIHGRPALRGTFLIGLINGSREFLDDLDFECNESQGDAYGYRAYTRRKSDGKTLYGPWITWAMVKAEGWSTKTGSKWKSMPELMFQYRAAAFWSRLFAPHITLGLYESEEARDFLEGDYETVPTRAQQLERKLDGAIEGQAIEGAEQEPQAETVPKKRGTRKAVKTRPTPEEEAAAKQDGAESDIAAEQTPSGEIGSTDVRDTSPPADEGKPAAALFDVE